MAEGIRINKYLSEAGICSRRAADEYILKGRITINGKPAEMGQKIEANDKVMVDGKPVRKREETVILAYNKPLGLTCTASHDDPDNIFDHIKYPIRLQYVGRLDKDSQGLIFMTNDGDIVNKILRAGNNHEKEYIVTVNKPITDEFIKGMSNGVPILGTVTKKCLVKKESKNSFRIILTQGLNRQIRRMCEYFGYEVKKLERIRIMNVSLGNLKIGSWRYLTKKELAEINRLTENSSKTEEASI